MSIITGYRTMAQAEREDDRSYRFVGHFEAEADSPLDLLEAEPADHRRQQEIEAKLSGSRGTDWFDIYGSGQEVVQAIQAGDSRFMDALIPKIARLKPPHSEEAVWRQTKRRRKRVRGDHGNELDIHEARQGRLDRAWTRTKFEMRDQHDSRHVNLVINCSLNGGVTADEAQWRTAAAVAVYDELVRAGKSVAIYMVRTSMDMFRHHGGEINTLMVPVKRLGEQMSQYHVAAYCSASFTRAVMMYRYSNLLPDRVPSFGYGYAQDTPVLTRSLREMRKKGMYVIYLPHCFSQSAARRAVEDVVRQAAGKAA